jgi:hypothetical protein
MCAWAWTPRRRGQRSGALERGDVAASLRLFVLAMFERYFLQKFE